MIIITKFDVGDEVFVLRDNKIKKVSLTRLKLTQYKFPEDIIWRIDTDDWEYESKLFKTKEELINSL